MQSSSDNHGNAGRNPWLETKGNCTGLGLTCDEFAHRAANMYLNMIFRDGFYHADPHPGNYMLLPETVVGVVDCGMVGRIDDELRGDIRRPADRFLPAEQRRTVRAPPASVLGSRGRCRGRVSART